jgi:hypothetical protein
MESVQEKLAHFWNVKAPQISDMYTAPIDKPTLQDPQYVSEHAHTICKWLLETEKAHLPCPSYM